MGIYSIPTDIVHKEIDLIQNCINRMVSNSFLIKGWAITLVAALIALLADKVDAYVIAALAIIILVCFWSLDAFFLKAEHFYRKKYEWVIQMRIQGITDYLYDLNPYNEHMWLKKEDGNINISQIMFSKALVLFYGIPLIVSILTVVLNLVIVVSINDCMYSDIMIPK